MNTHSLFIKPSLCFSACFFCTLAQAQDETQKRIAQLEAQLEQVHAEIEALKKNASEKTQTTETANKETPKQQQFSFWEIRTEIRR